MKKILVTGVGGNVGQAVAEYLDKQNFEVTGIYRKSKPKNANYRLCQWDLVKKIEHKEKFDVIIHAAAALNGTIDQLVDANIIATGNLVEFAKERKVKSFIYMSTISTYGQVKGELSEESDRINVSLYGDTKRIAETLVLESSIERKIVLALPRMIGPHVDLEKIGNSGFLKMTRAILKNEDVACYIPHVLYNNFLHTDDLCKFIKMLLSQIKWSYDKLLLGAKEKYTMIQILQIMKAVCQSESNIVSDESAGSVPICAEISIKKAESMGFDPEDAKEMIKKFVSQLSGK